MKSDLLQDILAKLDRGGSPDSRFPDHNGEYWTLCPYHADQHPNGFSVSAVGYNCFACGAKGGLRELAKKLGVRLRDMPGVAGVTKVGYTLAQYAEDKQLPEEFLRGLGLSDRKVNTLVWLRIPYRDENGKEVTTRYRIAATGDKFRWNKGSKIMLYGLDRLDRTRGYVHLVEGESDTQTLWLFGEPALGVPGASTWKTEWAERLAGLTVYLWQEPDQGGRKFIQSTSASLPNAKVIIAPPGRKDVSDCHLHGEDISTLMATLRASAQEIQAWRAEEVGAAVIEARSKARALLTEPEILSKFLDLCRAQGLVGEERTVKLLYLALTSRLLDHPVSVVVKGPSSGGKSFTVDTTLKAFPPSAFYALSSMSDRALAYSSEPLQHRHLVLYEAAGLAGDFATYLMRTLLSEGCIRYETVEKTSEGIKPKMIERAGPTGLIVTTTAASLHPENETRMFSVTVRDSPQQTSGVLNALADRANGRELEKLDVSAWHALQDWLHLAGCSQVTIPYAPEIARRADSRAVRLRRDFGAILNLVRAHAILHQLSRERDEQGRIIATPEDYRVVYDLVIDIVSEGVQASVTAEVRAAVEAVRTLDAPNGLAVTFKRVGEHLGIDKASAKRRCEVAIKDGYLVNRQQKRNQPAMLSVGDPLPTDLGVLPRPDELDTLVSPETTVQPRNRGDAEPDCREVVEDQRQWLEAATSGADQDVEPLEPWQLSFLAEADEGPYSAEHC